MNTKNHNPPRLPATPEIVRAGNPPRMAARRLLCLMAALLAFCASRVDPALAGPVLVIEMPSGAILYEDHATEPWYPASLTKLMTVYVALSAVRDHRITFDTPLAVSARAASMPPSKMGFRPGSLVTLDNALKMLMVKSANDMAVVIAEGVSGSIEAFAEDMNSAARELGLSQSHFVNPNGLPNQQHVSSARDFAVLARALYLTFPEQAKLFNIGAMRLGGDIIHNHNDLLGRYPGVDGMKTGFTCAAGFNIVASASQGGRQLIVVIMGAPNPRSRMIMAAALFDRGFTGIDKPSRSLADLASQTSMAVPPDMHQSVCGRRGKAIAEFNTDISRLMAPLLAHPARAPAAHDHLAMITTEAFSKPLPMAPRIAMVPRPAFEPVPVYVGAPSGFAGLVAQARPPHSPVGTPAPPETVSAYAATDAQATGDISSPLAPAADALPMKGEGAHSAQPLHAKRAAEARHHGRHGKIATVHEGRHGSHKAVKTARHTASAKIAAHEKSNKHKKLVANQHPPAKAASHAEKAKSKKPEKHAQR
ncbi:MAG TPA: serine hydrolase [Methylocella sp.]|nr:serine hydrolase [Methylocella sp.]